MSFMQALPNRHRILKSDAITILDNLGKIDVNALRELDQKCKNAAHKIPKDLNVQLHKHSLVNFRGSVSENVKNVVQCFVKVGEDTIIIKEYQANPVPRSCIRLCLII